MKAIGATAPSDAYNKCLHDRRWNRVIILARASRDYCLTERIAPVAEYNGNTSGGSEPPLPPAGGMPVDRSVKNKSVSILNAPDRTPRISLYIYVGRAKPAPCGSCNSLAGSNDSKGSHNAGVALFDPTTRRPYTPCMGLRHVRVGPGHPDASERQASFSAPRTIRQDCAVRAGRLMRDGRSPLTIQIGFNLSCTWVASALFRPARSSAAERKAQRRRAESVEQSRRPNRRHAEMRIQSVSRRLQA